MALFSSAFPLKRSAKIAVFAAFVLVVLQLLPSFSLTFIADRALGNISEGLGRVYASKVTYDFIRGVTFHDVTFIDGSNPPRLLFSAKRLSLRISLAGFLNRKLKINKVSAYEAKLYAARDNRTFEKLSILGQAALDEFLKFQLVPLTLELDDIRLTTRRLKVVFIPIAESEENLWVLDINSRLRYKSSGDLIGSGNLRIQYQFPAGSAFSKIFKDGLIDQRSQFSLEGRLSGKELDISSVDLSFGYDRISGQALVKDLDTASPVVNVILSSTNLSIENISSLVREFGTQGTFNASFALRGRQDALKMRAAFNFLGCSFSFGDTVFRNIVGRAIVTQNKVSFEDIFFIAGENSISLDSAVEFKQDKLIFSSDAKFIYPKDKKGVFPTQIKLDFNRSRKDNADRGNILFTLISNEGRIYTLDLRDYSLSRQTKGSVFQAKEFIFLDKDATGKEQEKKLLFENLDTGLTFLPAAVVADKLSLKGFGGLITGNGRFSFSPSKFTAVFKARDINAEGVQEGLRLPYNLLGKIDASIFFDSTRDKFCHGMLLIKKGALKETALLISLSNFMRIPSLKTIDFDSMRLYFAFFSNGLYRYGLKSFGEKADLKGNLSIVSNRQLSGFFSAALSQQLLGESPQFRRMLKIIEPRGFVEFPFTLSGTIHTPRLSWLENSFKRSLARLIPGWYKRGMQRGVDSVIEEMFKE